MMVCACIVVAPHVGAWIEMIFLISSFIVSLVAPHVGAWIEIFPILHGCLLDAVAPHVGAWIEIVNTRHYHGYPESLLM